MAEDGELLFKGGQVFTGYWRNDAATAEVLGPDGWFHTGDVGEVDDEGFVRITGRKKEILVTAGGKNVAPAVLEDRVRAHALVDQCLVVGDGQPFIAALVTLDRESVAIWAEQHGKTAKVADLVDDTDLRAEIEGAVEDANKAVSKAESIRKFRILAGRVDRGGRAAHAQPEAQAERRHARGQGRRRRAYYMAPASRPLTAPYGTDLRDRPRSLVTRVPPKHVRASPLVHTVLDRGDSTRGTGLDGHIGLPPRKGRKGLVDGSS